MKRILVAFGTRPEAVKMCPVIKELRKNKKIDVKILFSGQHESMLKQVTEPLGIVADVDLSIMHIGQTLTTVTVEILRKMSAVLKELLPDIVLVHGDTSTAFTIALASFYEGIDVAHVEAGLRTYDINNPYPEEFNRRAISLIAKYHFAPSEDARNNLLSEGIAEEGIFVTGNTVIDALIQNLEENYEHPCLPSRDTKFILLTAHRRENIGDGLRGIFRATRRISEAFHDIRIIYPIHKNEKIRETAREEIYGVKNIDIIEPLPPCDFHNFLSRACFVITDSGGIQEEAAFLGKPVLVARKVTERKELLAFGGVKLVGIDENAIFENVKTLLENREKYEEMSHAAKPFGDGTASEKIAKILGDALLFS